MGVHVWKWFGVTMIYWLAALQTINVDLYEAARVDGANFRSGTVICRNTFQEFCAVDPRGFHTNPR